MNTILPDERHLFFEGKIFVRFTARELVIETEGRGDVLCADELKLAISEAICRKLEDEIPDGCGS